MKIQPFPPLSWSLKDNSKSLQKPSETNKLSFGRGLQRNHTSGFNIHNRLNADLEVKPEVRTFVCLGAVGGGEEFPAKQFCLFG